LDRAGADPEQPARGDRRLAPRHDPDPGLAELALRPRRGGAASCPRCSMKADAMARPLPFAARLADLRELTKPGITLMVVLTAGMGYLLAEGRILSWATLLHTLVGTGLVSAGASVLNQVLERRYDALM